MNNESILQEILQLGCSDLVHCAATYKLNLKLTEILDCSISHHFAAKINKLYLKVKNSESSEEKYFIAVLSTKQFSFNEFQEYKKELGVDRITIAICEPSSTILFYELIDDFL